MSEGMKWTATCGPRQLKGVKSALARLGALRSSWVEVCGVIGGESRESVLQSLAGPHSNADAVERWNRIGELYGWTITRENFASVTERALAEYALGRAALPVIDNRETAEAVATRDAARREREAKMSAEQDARAARCAAITSKRPAGAVALIVAELVEDVSDASTDYFATKTTRRVAIGWRTGAREDFRQLRRAAAGFADTAHLGPDAGPDVEHRENYSMGAGNYLKAGSRYSSGWTVSSENVRADGTISISGGDLEDALPVATSATPKDAGAEAYSVVESANRRGPFYLVVLRDRLERDAFERVRESARVAGGWYSRAFGKAPGGFGFTRAADASAWAAAELKGEGVAVRGDTLTGERLEREASDDRCVALFEPRAEVTFAELLDMLKMSKAELRVTDGRGSCLVRSDAGAGASPRYGRWCSVWDNGGEVGCEVLEKVREGQRLGDFFPLRLSAGLVDAFALVNSIFDSMERQSRGEDGRGGDAAPQSSGGRAGKFRDIADRLTGEIEDKRAPLSQNWTHRRAGIKAGQMRTADRLEELQRALRALASDASVLPGMRTRKAVESLLCAWNRTPEQDAQLLELRALMGADPSAAEKEKTRVSAERRDALRGMDIPGFFPSPPAVVARVVELLELSGGMSMLEPSAGIGDLARGMSEAAPSSPLVVVERVDRLCDVLRDAVPGAELIRGDCLSALEGRRFARIGMNPPFERGADAEHVRAMLAHLEPGGVLVSVMTGRGADQLEAEGVVEHREDLPPGAFAGADAFRTTGVRAVVVRCCAA